MPTLYTTIGPWTFPTFNLFIALAVLVSAGIGLRRISRPGAVVDVYLGTLVGAVAGARLFHVLLNWDYFADALNEITVISLGGLDWHGAVLGGIIGLYVAYRIRMFVGTRLSSTSQSVLKSPLYEVGRGFRGGDDGHALPLHQPISFRALLDALTPALPLIGLAGWWGCLAASCGYGAEVDNLSHYPPLVAAETADVYGIVVPRYNTQLFGLILAAVVLFFVALLFWRGWLRDRRFWLTLALLSAGMFVIGFFRGDHTLMLFGLRADQFLDMLFAVAAAVTLVLRRPSPSAAP